MTPMTEAEYRRTPSTDAEYRRILEEKCARLERELGAWILAAYKCGIYRADIPHNTPELWATQVNAETELLNERDRLKQQLEAIYNADGDYSHQLRQQLLSLRAELERLRDIVSPADVESIDTVLQQNTK